MEQLGLRVLKVLQALCQVLSEQLVLVVQLVLQEHKVLHQQLLDQQVLQEILALRVLLVLQEQHQQLLVLLELQVQLEQLVQQQMSYIHFYLEPFSKLKRITKGK
jgi:hypothetical protein